MAFIMSNAAWAIVDSDGKAIAISLVHDEELYKSAYFSDDFLYQEGKDEPSPDKTLKEVVLNNKYQCIPVTMFPDSILATNTSTNTSNDD